MLRLINYIKLIIRVVGIEKKHCFLSLGEYIFFHTTRSNFSWICIVSISIRLFSSFFVAAINIHPERLIRAACKTRLFVWRYLFALLIDSNVLGQIRSNNRRNTNFSIEKILYKIIYKALRDNDRVKSWSDKSRIEKRRGGGGEARGTSTLIARC